MRSKKNLFILLTVISISIFGIIMLSILPQKVLTSSYKDYRVAIYQHSNTLKLRYYSYNSLSEEREMFIKEKITKDNISIEWFEDTIEGNFGEKYPEISLNVSVIDKEGTTIPFFEWKMYNLTKPE